VVSAKKSTHSVRLTPDVYITVTNFNPLLERACGVLLHVSSLPSPWGIGDLGAPARRFVERLGESGQRYWQTLPLNPTTGGDSPYFSNSSFAGNPLLLSLEDLEEDGLLRPSELADRPSSDAGVVDFAMVRRIKEPLVERAARRLVASRDPGLEAFCRDQASWIDDHALFTALARGQGEAWRSWPAPLKARHPEALEAAAAQLHDAIALEKAVQFLFHRQWQRLRGHCARHGVVVFGDMPIYVNLDSADVWSNPCVFQLDEALEPRLESGVPPDYFSATGQLWRNPVFDWSYLEATGFHWWIERLRVLLERFDVLRIDHFRGLAQYWAVEAGAEDATVGQWLDVPSHGLFDALRAAVQPLPLVAEDLGTITPDVIALRDYYDLPGMIVLQFAFGDDHHDNPYKPENHRENAVAYIGTHDNTTCAAWLAELDDAARWRLGAHVPAQHGGDGVRAMIDLLLASSARTAIVCAQDLLELGADARMNVPGIAHGNWRWRLTPAQFDALPLAWLGERCRVHGRAGRV